MGKEIDNIPIKEGTENEVDLDEFMKKVEEAKKSLPENTEEETTQEDKDDSSVVEQKEEDEEDEFIEETETKENKKQQTDYDSIIEKMPELKQDLDYLIITNKIKEGIKLSDKEMQFKEVYEEAKQKEQAFILANELKEKEEQERQKELQERVNREYEELKASYPEKIEVHDENALALKGSDNFLKVALTFIALKKSHKKGGKIFIKVARPKKVSIEWTTKEVRFVEFWSTNERGDKIKEVSRVNQYEYTFEGTSIPVIFAVQGFAEAWDFYSEFRKDLSSEIVSGIAMEAYNTGYKDGLVISDKKKDGGMLGTLEHYMPLILVGGLLVLGWMMWQMYGSMTQVYQTTQAMQSQLNTLQALQGMVLK